MSAASAAHSGQIALARFWRFEAQFLKRHRVRLAICLLAMLLQSLLVLPIPVLQGWLLDRLVASGPAGPLGEARDAWPLIGMVFGVCLAAHFARLALSWRVAAVMTKLSLDVVRLLTDAMHRKLHRLPLSYFEGEQTGGVMARITSDVGSLLIFLSNGCLQLVADLVLAVAIAFLLAWVHFGLALLAFVVMPVYALNHRFFATAIRRLSGQLRAQTASVYSLLSERLSAIRVVRSFAQEDAEIAVFDDRIDEQREVSWEAVKAGGWQGAVAVAISGLGAVAVLGGGATLTSEGTLSVGDLLVFCALSALLYNPLVRLTQFYGTISATLVAVSHIEEVLSEREAVMDLPGARELVQPRGALTFENVSFRYAVDGPLVLDRVSFRAEAGTTIGILGASGAGKSTLLALAPRLYDVADGYGVVHFDGRPVKEWRLGDLRRTVALVTQQAVLFNDTIRANLTYACADAAPARIRRALEIADLATLVDHLPQGLDTPVGERGLSLSGGQRQRLALARALVANPAVLLLDDCTSALDAETEARIQQALHDRLQSVTRIIVSNKIASLRDADIILVMQSGRIVEQGDRATLLAQDGLYARAARQQMLISSY